jgi:hypothetical protein
MLIYDIKHLFEVLHNEGTFPHLLVVMTVRLCLFCDKLSKTKKKLIKMLKRCIIPECSLEGESSQIFPFPKDFCVQDQWMLKIPLLDLSSLNFQEAVICEHHFNPKEVTQGPGYKKELSKGALPEYFPGYDDINSDSCRFCLKKLEEDKIPIDQIIKGHYQNLIQEEFNTNIQQIFTCANCYNAIRKSSLIKSKVIENQIKLNSFPQKYVDSEFLEIKMEVYQSDEEIQENTTSKVQEETLKFNLFNEDSLVKALPTSSKKKRRTLVKKKQPKEKYWDKISQLGIFFFIPNPRNNTPKLGY